MDVYRVFQKIAKIAAKPFTQASQERVEERQPVKRESDVGELFGKKLHIHRREMREFLEELPDIVPGAGRLTKEERLAIAEEAFPKKRYGGYITVPEFRRGLRHFKKAKRRVIESSERAKMRTKIKLLEGLEPKKEDEK